MPQFVTIVGCEAPAEAQPRLRELGIAAGEDTHTLETLDSALMVAADIHSVKRAHVLYRDTSEWLQYGVFRIDLSDIDRLDVLWSLDADELVESEARPAAEVEVPLTVDADELLDVLEAALAEEGDPARARDQVLVLPDRFADVPRALQALAQVAARLEPKRVQVLVELNRCHYEVTLERKKGVTLTPLHPWLEDDEARSFVRATLGAPVPEAFEPCPKQPTRKVSKRDPARPFTTGSLTARLDSAIGASLDKFTEGRFVKWTSTPGAFEQVEAALRAPENAGAGFAPVRARLYELLPHCSPEKALPALVAALEREEGAAARGQIYATLSRVEDPAAHRALARGLTVEPPEVCERLAQVIWRQSATVELLVREYLVPAWQADRALAHRIVKVLREEFVQVQPAWVSGAPEELRKMLEPLFSRE